MMAPANSGDPRRARAEVERLRADVARIGTLATEARWRLASEVDRVRAEAGRLCAAYPHNPEMRDLTGAVGDLLRAVGDAAYPDEDLERLRAGDPAAVETAIRFLEADPWFFRSGYLKADVIRILNRLPLAAEDSERLRRVVLAVVDGHDRREFRSSCRLARRVADPALAGALEERLSDPDAVVRRHARWVLGALGQKEC